jgi:hypothetical protein
MISPLYRTLPALPRCWHALSSAPLFAPSVPALRHRLHHDVAQGLEGTGRQSFQDGGRGGSSLPGNLANLALRRSHTERVGGSSHTRNAASSPRAAAWGAAIAYSTRARCFVLWVGRCFTYVLAARFYRCVGSSALAYRESARKREGAPRWFITNSQTHRFSAFSDVARQRPSPRL